MRLFFIIAMLIASTLSYSKELTLTSDNTLVFNSAFTAKSVSKLIVEAKEMDSRLQSGYPIYLFLDTPGGSIQAGLELIEALNGLNRPVHTVTLFAASMGWQLLQHLGTRYILKYGRLMSHKARGRIDGEFGGGFSQLDARYGVWLRTIDTMDKQTVKRTNGIKTLKQYRSEYDNELWLNGQEAVKNGYADEVVSVKCDQSLDSLNRNVTINYMGMNFNLNFSGCPLITYPTSIERNIRTNKGILELDDFINQGGRFGEDCVQKDTKAIVDSYGTVLKPEQKSELCAVDKELTFEKIKELENKELENFTQKSKQPIYMTFL